jgi:hypothetical protein
MIMNCSAAVRVDHLQADCRPSGTSNSINPLEIWASAVKRPPGHKQANRDTPADPGLYPLSGGGSYHEDQEIHLREGFFFFNKLAKYVKPLGKLNPESSQKT